MAQATSGLVDYGSTSEEDNFSDLEWPEAPESPLSASLGMSRWYSNASLPLPDFRSTSGSEQSDSELDQSAQAADSGPSPEVLTIDSSSEEEEPGEARQLPARRPGQQQQSEDDTESPTDAGDSSDSHNSKIRSASPPLLLRSSSEEVQEPQPPSKRPRLQISGRGAGGRGAYALKFHQLTPGLRDLLTRSRAFFTKPHSLQRPGGPVTISTYSKAEERILCKSLGCLGLHFLVEGAMCGGVIIFQVDF